MRGKPGRGGGGKVVAGDPAPPSETVTDYVDFDPFDSDPRFSTGEWFTVSKIGPGRDLQRYVLTASTKAAYVPSTGTNGLYGQFAGALTSGTTVQSMTVSDYTLDMSDVEHECFGIQTGYVRFLTVRNLRVRGVLGSSSTPPHETMSLSVWHCGEGGGAVVLDDIILDGTNRDNDEIAATLLGLNDAYNCTVTGLRATGAIHGFGVALWQCGGTHVFDDPDFRFCRRAINHEQPRPNSSFTYNRPDCRNQTGSGGGRPHVTFNGNLTIGGGQSHPTLTVVEPLWDRSFGRFRVGVNQVVGSNGNGLYAGLPNTCRMEDVTVIIDGVTYNGPQNNSIVAIGPYW